MRKFGAVGQLGLMINITRRMGTSVTGRLSCDHSRVLLVDMLQSSLNAGELNFKRVVGLFFHEFAKRVAPVVF